jgi:HNH endonuclease/AP2 domain
MTRRTVDLEALADKIRRLWRYDPETGVIFGKRLGKPIGVLRKDGALHCLVQADGYPPTSVLLHRAAWLLHFGRWPTAGLDHKNGDRADNRIDNLREADQSDNRQNLGKRTAVGRLRGTTRKADERWIAQIRPPGGVTIYVGTYATEEEAHAAYCSAKKILHPFQPIQRTN